MSHDDSLRPLSQQVFFLFLRVLLLVLPSLLRTSSITFHSVQGRGTFELTDISRIEEFGSARFFFICVTSASSKVPRPGREQKATEKRKGRTGRKKKSVRRATYWHRCLTEKSSYNLLYTNPLDCAEYSIVKNGPAGRFCRYSCSSPCSSFLRLIAFLSAQGQGTFELAYVSHIETFVKNLSNMFWMCDTSASSKCPGPARTERG